MAISRRRRVISIPLHPIAFSSEVDPGSRKENASKQKPELGSDSIRTKLRRDPFALGKCANGGLCPRPRISRGEICRSAQPIFQNFILFEQFQIALPLNAIGIILRAN
jgi:hypothetical protein